MLVHLDAKLTDVLPTAAANMDSGAGKGAAAERPARQPSVRTITMNCSFRVPEGKTAVLPWGTRLEESLSFNTVVHFPCPPVLDYLPFLTPRSA
jgi:hypothetical protein